MPCRYADYAAILLLRIRRFRLRHCYYMSHILLLITPLRYATLLLTFHIRRIYAISITPPLPTPFLIIAFASVIFLARCT